MIITNYRDEYKQAIDDLQKAQWGEGSDSDDIISSLNNHHIKVALNNNEVVGVSVCKINNNVCHIDFIIIKAAFQKQGIGSLFMKDIIEYAEKNNVSSIECEAIDVLGKVNSERLLEKFGFSCSSIESNYWGNLYPDFDCKECNHKPCICTMKKYKKITNSK